MNMIVIEYIAYGIGSIIAGGVLGYLVTSIFLAYLRKRIIKRSVKKIFTQDQIFYVDGKPIDLKGDVQKALNLDEIGNPIKHKREKKGGFWSKLVPKRFA